MGHASFGLFRNFCEAAKGQKGPNAASHFLFCRLPASLSCTPILGGSAGDMESRPFVSGRFQTRIALAHAFQVDTIPNRTFYCLPLQSRPASRVRGRTFLGAAATGVKPSRLANGWLNDGFKFPDRSRDLDPSFENHGCRFSSIRNDLIRIYIDLGVDQSSNHSIESNLTPQNRPSPRPLRRRPTSRLRTYALRAQTQSVDPVVTLYRLLLSI